MVDNLGWWDQFAILLVKIFDLLNPNFDKYIHFPNLYQNLGLKGQKLSKFWPIRWQIDPIIPNYPLYWNLNLKNCLNFAFVRLKCVQNLIFRSKFAYFWSKFQKKSNFCEKFDLWVKICHNFGFLKSQSVKNLVSRSKICIFFIKI